MINTEQSESGLNFERLHTELWTSWASLLRSYAAAHGLNATQHAVIEVSANEITLRLGGHWLKLATNSEGFGGLQYDNGSGSPFVLREDGQVLLEGSWMEMDIAAERLTREMFRQSGNGNKELGGKA